MASSSKGKASENSGQASPVVIKKYANRRLYNTATSSYVTLEYLAQMVRDGIDFVVYDAKSSEDITRSVLAQIIFEEEAKGQNLLPINFLREMIRFYGQNVSNLLPGYLEHSMDMFVRNQENLSKAMGGNTAMKSLEDITRQNLTMIERASQIFTPFSGINPLDQKGDMGTDQFDLMRAQMQQLQEQLDMMGRFQQSMRPKDKETK
ncbi:MAG TPA: polyhydroxyalkanoate synthesis repressor PhaR [Alphaproteobacteria bacterium]|nr:polyhydroxyalkanoate synthesis repressor PhaR [Paracoccaceae bacterium]RCL81051.1 MAG: polyhydroxyalkanoate synthesis repressor PhaR [SAR116 cluster bacterium]RPH13773.1 MAG: polyhydroxyalkanoate synthesis repressor PhaR [Alphaproteobacteria bacterium TMED150]HCJ61450.1 polyhydroxyalkanoate synthesis repressor PhaR [Alphaproteobacteria bacterium]HCY47983.1 polyhydroxyalkanoate synthesis repressor PhaR [Alphaproteobacteria bacterium]|tara:strand:+ start:1457 stop:2074 length:618 start_codon:yes stop_codon:yes gene_type:complete